MDFRKVDTHIKYDYGSITQIVHFFYVSALKFVVVLNICEGSQGDIAVCNGGFQIKKSLIVDFQNGNIVYNVIKPPVSGSNPAVSQGRQFETVCNSNTHFFTSNHSISFLCL